MAEATKIESKKAEGKYFQGLGRRKSSTARVRLFNDKKKQILINGKEYKEALVIEDLIRVVEEPLKACGKMDASITIRVCGGGTRSQAQAIRHGIARALIKMDKELKPTLKPLGCLTRDPREKERKKPGLKKARRAPQWSKR